MDALQQKPRLLLLNPPGRQVYLRDYYCSKVSQADYVNQPIDLVYLSGWLDAGFDLALIDAIVDRLDPQRCLEAITTLAPHIIVGLIGSVSYAEDVAFYRRLGDRLPTPIILSGDILLDQRSRRLRELDFASAFVHDFSGDDLVRYLSGERHGLHNLTFRYGDSAIEAPVVRSKKERFSLPLPRHDLFAGKAYRYPFVRRQRFATIMTEFGCPYTCTFCIMGTLGWRLREPEDVLDELALLQQLGIRELFLLDQTFGIQKDRAHALLGGMLARGFDFGWVCFSRPDILDDALLRQMRRAGCHTVILGLESGDQQVLDSAQKAYTLAEIRAGFRRCKLHGLRTVATVIIGLPQETEASFRRTLAFLRDVDCDFASFNVAVPRMGTELRRQALALGLITPEVAVMDQSGTEVAMPALTLSRRQIAAMKQRAVREFYLNRRFLARRLLAVRSFDDLRIQVRQGIGLLRQAAAAWRRKPVHDMDNVHDTTG